jgi:ubiquinone biosynthesis monooxygenase Coq7
MNLSPSRDFNALDQLVAGFDDALRAIAGRPHTTERANPAAQVKASEAAHELSDAERQHAAGLMRVNHAGEIAAQGLYQGQALTAKLGSVREQMERAALEEEDHLAWCESRLTELGSGPSALAPLWFGGAYAIGALAGAAGDRWSLGFVVETEQQVVKHLESHLEQLPEADPKSRAVVAQMRADEQEHAHLAKRAGAAELPAPFKALMRLTAKVMTTTAYRL